MTYQLVYFAMRGRGEPIRWILKASDIDFTEETIDMLTEWKSRKNDYDWAKVPVLVVDGQQLHQTTVIARYLGEAHNFISKDLWTVTRQQEVAEGVHDVGNLMAELLLARLRKQESVKSQMYQRAKMRIPEVFANVEKAITEDGWIFSDTMTWVDVFVAANLDIYQAYFSGTLDERPKCQELLNRVSSLPKIADWIENRPQWNIFENPIGLEG